MTVVSVYQTFPFPVQHWCSVALSYHATSLSSDLMLGGQRLKSTVGNFFFLSVAGIKFRTSAYLPKQNKTSISSIIECLVFFMFPATENRVERICKSNVFMFYAVSQYFGNWGCKEVRGSPEVSQFQCWGYWNTNMDQICYTPYEQFVPPFQILNASFNSIEILFCRHAGWAGGKTCWSPDEQVDGNRAWRWACWPSKKERKVLIFTSI